MTHPKVCDPMAMTLNVPPDLGDVTMRKIRRRLVPLLALLYFFAFVDRTNLGFAALEMNEDLGISAAQFGLVAGLFSIGYFLFEVPSNVLMRRYGPRKWIARILFSWGLVAAGTAFVQNFTQLAIMRTVLGIAEAGFIPCVLLYLTLWFPERERARVVAQFLVALPLATVIGGPLSGWILDHVHWLGLESWRWVFFLQGAPTVLLAFVVLKVFVDQPHQAKWLTTQEKAWLEDTLTRERLAKEKRYKPMSFWRSVFGFKVVALAFIYYSKTVAMYILAFFTPAIVKALSGQFTNTTAGYLTAIPYGCAAVFMVFWAKHSDKTRERRWHVAIPMFLVAVPLLFLPMFTDNVWVSLAILIVVVTAVHATYGPFWALPSLFLTGNSAGVGLAAINSLASLGGFVGPFAFGALQSATGGITWGTVLVSAGCLIAGILVVSLNFVRQAEKLDRDQMRLAAAAATTQALATPSNDQTPTAPVAPTADNT